MLLYMAILDKKERLWIEYSHSKSTAVREELIMEYVSLVKLVAGRLAIYLGANVEYDDLVSYGIFGLIDAIDKFDYGKGIKFETYASLRIRGSILDQIRKMDWIPRSVRQKQKSITEASKKLEALKGPNYSDADTWMQQTNVTNISSLDDFMEQGNDVKAPAYHGTGVNPENRILKEELKTQLTEALSMLTEKEKTVVLLYYYEDLTLKEISRVMEVSESRISQLHSKALTKMRRCMNDNFALMMG